MNETIFENISFNEDHQQKILRSIKKSKSRNKGFIFKDRFNGVLSIAVTSCLFLGIAYFAGTKTHLLNGGQGTQGRITDGSQQETQVNKTVYTPPKQAEYYQDMTKEEILTKMINTVDNFETAKGEFKTHDYISPGYQVVDYELSLHHNAGGYNIITNVENGKEQKVMQFYKDGSENGTSWEINNQLRTYSTSVYHSQKPRPRPRGTLTIKAAFTVDKEGNNVTDYRERPTSNESLFPYEIASNYTRDLNKWEIEKQNEMLLGHNTLVIKGKLDDYARIKHKSETFRFWVDKDTGILLKYETYNAAGNVVNYLYPTKLEINIPIDSKEFVPNLDGYNKEKKFLTSKLNDLYIPKELKAQAEEAKKHPTKTTVFHLNDLWYIYPKKGFKADRIQVKGKEATVYLVKVSPEEARDWIPSLADGYKIDKLNVVE